jgi:hypothetical protein
MADPTKGPLIARGRTAEIFAWQDDQILKLFFDWCPANWVQREIKINQVLAKSDLPAPKLMGVVEVDGRQGIIYERVNGPSMLTLMSSRPWLLVKFARLSAELHTKIHKCQGDGLASLRASLRGIIERLEVLQPGTKDEVLAILDELPDGTALCHFDFHPDQVLITSQGPVVIDWMTAFQGDPSADVARTAVMSLVGQIPYGSPFQRKLVSIGKGMFYRIYLAHYLELNPAVSKAEINRWMIPVAAGRLNENIAGELKALLEFIQSGIEQRKSGG